MYFILYLVILQTVSSDPVYTREELFEVTDYNPERFSVNISSEIQGSIVLKWSSSSSFSIYIQISTEDIRSQNPVHIQTNFTLENLHLRILKEISDTIVSSPASLNANRGLATVGSVLLTFWVIILSHGWKVALLYMVLLLSLFLLVEGSSAQNTRCDIVVECPRNISLKRLKLFVEDGNITVDRTLLQVTDTTPECMTSSNHALDGRGCLSCCYGNGVCGPGNVCKCFKGFKKDKCEKPDIPKYKLFVNPGDSRVTQIRLSNKDLLTIHGRKRHDGTIRSLDTFKSRDKIGNDVTIFLNRKRTISNILSNSGSVITFNWKNKCIVHVTAITSNSIGQVNIEVNTCASVYDLLTIDSDWRTPNYSAVLETAIKKCFHDDREVRSTNEHLNVAVKVKSKLNSKYFVPVKVTRCGSPVTSGNVYAHVKGKGLNPDESLISEFIAKPTKKRGIYHVQIPTHSVRQDTSMKHNSCASFNSTVKRTCRKVLSKLACDKIKFCLSIRKAFRFVKSVESTQIDDVIYACEKAFDTVLLFCSTISYALQMQNVGSCAADDNLIEESYIPGPILFSPFAVLPNGHKISSDFIEINPSFNKKYNKELVLKDKRPNPTITSFSITPEDPKPLQRYEVKVNYSCASNATVIDMKIIGSDKYTNYATCYGLTSCDCCVLHVAGAAAAVKDFVTVTVTDSLINLNFTREFVVIF